MKATGIVRRIDDLGRVVIPKEIRRTLRIRESDPLEIFTDREGEIILKKYSPIGELSTFIAAAGSGSREFADRRIHSELETMIADRKNVCVTEKKFVKIIEDDNMEYSSQAIYTITCAGDAVGSVLILDKTGNRKFTETEEKLALAASGFLGRQMEQ